MSALWLFLRHTKAGRGVLAVIAAVALIGTLWVMAFTQGRDSNLQKQLERAVKAWETRNEIETDIDRLDDVQLCIELGGVRKQCSDELRGLGKAAEAE
ncbi:MAG: hypothetical protein V7703_21735 [Hyphomicrobiales bacterium]